MFSAAILDSGLLDSALLESGLLRSPMDLSDDEQGLAIATNNLSMPYTFNTSANWVHNARTYHRSGPVSYTDIEIWFLNGIKGANSEQDAGYDFDLRAGVELNGTYYPGYHKVGGSRDATIAKEWGIGKLTFPGLTLPASAVFAVLNRRVASDGGLAGSYDVITNTSGITARGDGIIAGTDDSVDYTTGTSLADGASVRALVSGDFTGTVLDTGTFSGFVDEAGSGYASGLVLSTWYGASGIIQKNITGATQANPVVITSADHTLRDGDVIKIRSVGGMTELNDNEYIVSNKTDDTFELHDLSDTDVDGTGFTAYTSGGNFQAEAPGREYDGVGITGFGTQSAGALASVTISDGGGGHDTSSPPLLFVGGGGGFGAANQTVYGPVLIMGRPVGAARSYMTLVDSIGAGFSSVDDTGDLNASHGGLEQAIGQSYPVMRFGTASDSLGGFVLNKTKQMALLDEAIAAGLDMTKVHVIVQSGSNDFSNGDALATVETAAEAAGDEFRNRNAASVSVGTVMPITSSTNAYIDTTNQSTSGKYVSGGDVDQYNERLRKNTGNVTRDYVYDAAAIMADITEREKIRVDAYGGAPFVGDGTHPSKAVGVPYQKANLVYPPYAAIPGDTLVHVTALDTDGFTFNGEDISQWDDQSGNARHLVQSVTARQPDSRTARQKSHYGVDCYPGSVAKSVLTDDFAFDHTNFAFLAVMVSGTPSGVIQRIWGQYDLGTEGKGMSWGIDVNGRPFIFHNSGLSSVNSTDLTPTVDVLNIVGGWWDSGTLTFALNGSTSTNISTTGAAPGSSIEGVSAKFCLGGLTTNGASNTTQPLKGSVFELLFFEPADLADFTAKRDALNSRWRVY